jgi:hypothetical protein
MATVIRGGNGAPYTSDVIVRGPELRFGGSGWLRVESCPFAWCVPPRNVRCRSNADREVVVPPNWVILDVRDEFAIRTGRLNC